MNIGQDILLGIAIGDALGVPVEFKDRAYLQANPIKEMIGYRVHNQPKGTWSDDSSLSFCLADSLATNGYDLQDIAKNILDWFNKGLWTAHGSVFDIGGQTRSAIDELVAIFKRHNFGELTKRANTNEFSNGNGALMRILPLALETVDLKVEERFRKIKEVSSLTHGHIRSVLSCFIYITYAEELILGNSKWKAYLETQKRVIDAFDRFQIPSEEQQRFARLLTFNIANFEVEDIKSDGYVVHSLETCLWSILRNDSYQESVLAAINLGGDTDTNGAIVGGLAGLIYEESTIPSEWKAALVGRQKIEALGNRLYDRYY